MALKSYAVTTAARFSDFLEIATPTGAQLTIMEALINSVTEFIEGYTGRLKKTTYTQELYTTEKSQTINLRHFPAIQSSGLTLERRTSDLNEDDWEVVDSQYYFVDWDNGIIESVGDLYFSKTRNGYRVTYTAGYDFDNATTFLSDTEAGDVEIVAWRLLEPIWNKKKSGGDIQSERIGDYSVTYKKVLFADEDLLGILQRFSSTQDTFGVLTPSQV